VEDPCIVPELIKLGCDSVQGYHFARPMPADDLNTLLQSTFRHSDTPEHIQAPAP
jgi:EAL domain-containing protein (putative c-di-GMP-specific phosphodiesterase class I)